MAQSSGSTRKYPRDHDSASVASSKIGDVSEWEANEALRQRELEEAKGRAAQMEKTMRWWSDCTANWREKWSKVRNERNKAREECKQLRIKMDNSIKEVNTYKREKEDLENQNKQLKKDLEKIHLLLKHAGQFDSQILEDLNATLLDKEFNTERSCNSPLRDAIRDEERDSLQSNPECDCTASNCLGAQNKILNIPNNLMLLETNSIKHYDGESELDEHVLSKLSLYQIQLDEANKTINTEREEKLILQRNVERLTNELQEYKDKCDELRESKQDVLRDLLSLEDEHAKEVQILKLDLLDEINNREGMEKKMSDLRVELEKLQSENAAEWSKRERLDTEKLTLERDNKKLKNELRDMQERLEKKGQRNLSTSDTEIRHLQEEIYEKAKELFELKHSQNKLKKLLQDKISELTHVSRRSEQYDAEVKKLRIRVEDLKKDLAAAEDEVDKAQNHVRKLLRTNDELQEQVDSFQVQLQHLHSRLRNQNSSILLVHQASTLQESCSDAEDDNDFF